MTEKLTAPERIDLNEADVDALDRFPIHREGTFRGVITSAKRMVGNVGKTRGNLGIGLTIKPLTEDDQPFAGAQVYHNVWLPKRNPAVTNHTAPSERSLIQFGRAIDSEFLAGRPRYIKDTRSFTTDGGEPIDKNEYSKLKKQSNTAILQKAVSWYNEPEQLEDEVVYYTVTHNQSNGKIYANVGGLSSDPPEDAEVITDNFLV